MKKEETKDICRSICILSKKIEQTEAYNILRDKFDGLKDVIYATEWYNKNHTGKITYKTWYKDLKKRVPSEQEIFSIGEDDRLAWLSQKSARELIEIDEELRFDNFCLEDKIVFERLFIGVEDLRKELTIKLRRKGLEITKET